MFRCPLTVRLTCSLAFVALASGEPVPRMLPGELSADEILNGAYPFPGSPAVQIADDDKGFAKGRISKVPPPGVHPRILMSPEDLPDLRRRLRETRTGKALHATLRSRTDAALRNPKQWSSTLYDRLAAGDEAGVLALLGEQGGFPKGIGHYQPWVYAMVLEAFDALVSDDEIKGRKAATALATYAAWIRPKLEEALSRPLNDDVWRVKVSGPVTGAGGADPGIRELLGGHLLGYGYDFSYHFMTQAQRTTVRSVISTATHGRVWMGARLPHHFRNWNWIAVGLQQPLLALAIEGEEGYDPRVFKLGVQIARDYLTHGVSPSGQSTEAVGYTQFGLVWANPFFVAATRRGDNLLVHGHHRAMLDWYLQSMEPSMDRFTSHGDGGDGPPSIGTLAMWRYFFPGDSKADFLWQCFSKGKEGASSARDSNPFAGNFHLIEPLLWADDCMMDESGHEVAYADGETLGLPTAAFDPVRGSLHARSGWKRDAVAMQFECRVDSVGASHDHADRGNFTLFAHGRAWAKDNFRSVETRHHNNILIDGLGQGYWPGPGRWVGNETKGDLIIASVDAKDCYDWWWPKQIRMEQPDFIRFRYPRWQSYAAEAAHFRNEYRQTAIERDTRPAVMAFWEGFGKTDPRLWDEDSWPVRLPHNPLRRAFRSVVFHKGAEPWLLIVDDIQKDHQERLYEWLMQTGMDTEMISMSGSDMILGDATTRRNAEGEPEPALGERQLLVRIIDLEDPADPHHFTSRPSCRLETFERKDTLLPTAAEGALTGSRSFGLDKRLVLASRSVAPNFKILLFPHRHGDPLPTTAWNHDRSEWTLEVAGQRSRLGFTTTADGLTVISHLP